MAIVSERNAAEMAQVAQAFHAAIRSISSCSARPRRSMRFRMRRSSELVRSADAILITTVFKETAQRIIPVVRASNVKA